MTNTRIKISSIIENQLPQFVKEEFPLVEEFLSQYYISLENQGGVSDILQNIDQYIKVDNLTNLIESTTLTSNVTFFDSTINVNSTAGFSDSYGLLLIDSEIITYTSKTETKFEGCIRGFSGVTSYKVKDELTFTNSQSEEHISGSTVTNLSILFLKEFLNKVKKQVTPGFEDRELYSELNQNIFIKQSIDFYSSKGTDNSFKILFGALYGQNVEVIRPRDYLIQPSDAQYRITSDLVVESIEGDPENIVNSTLYQDKTDFTNAAQGTITKVEKIRRNSKDYYVISLDSDYDKDIEPIGSIYGKFDIHPKTKIVSSIVSGSTTIEVDSTVAFPTKNGNLIINLENGTSLNVTYLTKTLNQFLGCSGITQNIPESTEIKTDFYAYGYYQDEKVKIRILGVLSDLKIPKGTRFYSKDDNIKIKTLGIDLKDLKSNNWFFNISPKYEVESIELLDESQERNSESPKSYKINVYDNHSLKIGDYITLFSSGFEESAYVTFFNNEKSFSIQLGPKQPSLDLNLTYTVKKNLSKVSSENYPSVNQYTSNVQNIYSDGESLYVAAPSLPTYFNQKLKINDQSIVFPPDSTSKTFIGTILDVGKHGLYTGDAIVYKPSIENTLGISTGVYFVKKISETEIKLAKSRSNIFTDNFVTVNGTVTNAKFELVDFTYRDLSTQLLESQKLIRKISNPEVDSKIYSTDPGLTGIFINGVELLNYKSKDNVYYGPIEKIIPAAPGSNYDIIHPPTLSIFDPIGSGANAHCSVIGGLSGFNIIDPGFDYLEDPKIEIIGGNGSEASAKVNLVSFDHEISFNSQDSAGLVKLSPINTIGFSDYHKFRDAEEVIYLPEGQSAVGGISTNSSYFVSVQDAFTVKLHKSFSDAVSGINTIQLISYGVGNHLFKSKNKKKKIGSIQVQNAGVNYQNKLTTSNVSGINTALNTITIPNHGYQSGEIITYNATQTPIGGLSSSTSYYATKVNDDQFKLSSIGIGSLGFTTSFFYDTKQYINLTSTGSGIHKFNYPEIVVSIKGRIGVSTLSGQDFNAIIEPIFSGSIQSVFVESGGSKYGSEDIINYNRQPLFELNFGSGIELTPVISNGQIVDVLINSPGSGYTSPPNIEIIGDGIGAVLTPIFSNGSLVEVRVIYGGIGYNSNNTSIIVTPFGSGAKFEAQIKSWKINLVERAIQTSKITDDDGLLTSGLNSEYGLQYAHAYAPRQLRSLVQATTFRQGERVYIPDLVIENQQEVTSYAHSPIIGWAYDGNPIYGPYGFSAKTGGSIKSLVPGYELSLKSDRPSKSIYPEGFFVEDYTYLKNGDLDEHNGRFGVTPEYPNGVYAYFTTISNGDVEKAGLFNNYKKPVFPYAIGPTYKSKPIIFNFDNYSNQDFIDINQTEWKRNTTPYNLLNERSSYEYILNPNTIKPQNSVVKSISAGTIDSVEVISGGENYEVGDELVFKNKGNFIVGSKGKVSLIKGKPVSQITYQTIEIDNIQLVPYNSFIGISTIAHNLNNKDLVSFVSKNEFKGTKGEIRVLKNNLNINSNLEPTSVTGIITDIRVSGDLNYPNLNVNSFFDNKEEIIKILDIDSKKSTIKIERNQESTIGIDTNFAGSVIIERPNKFTIDFGISTSTYNFDRNKQIYFDAEKYVGLGTQYGVGITSTVFIDVSKFRSRVSIGTGSTTFLYFNDFRDAKKYKLKDYIELVDSTNPSFNVTQKQVVSIGNTFIVIDFDSSTLNGIGVGATVNKLDIIKLPTKAIRLPKHNLKPDTPIVYVPPIVGNPIGIGTTVISGIGSTDKLPSDLEIFPIILDEDTIGIATQPNSTIENGFFFTDSGSNDQSISQIHSFKTNYGNNLTGKIIKHVVTVSTAETHGLSLLDNVIIKVNVGITTTFIVKYDDYNRRMLINPKSFSSINTVNNTITIEKHKYYTGQKVLYTSNIPAIGLTNQNLYYVVVVDSNTIMLSDSYYESIKKDPEIVNILSSSAGTISAINPPIQVIRNQPITFDLSDSSLSYFSNVGIATYSAFDLKIYKDSQFIEEFDTTKSSPIFEVSKIGQVGIDSTASVTISINDKTPSNLYYKLVPINLDLNPQVKKDIIIDDEVISANKISIIESDYNGMHTIIGISSTSFQFNVLERPEFEVLISSSNDIEYYTDAYGVKGSIQEVSITNRGKGYTTFPSITSVLSDSGSGTILSPITNSIGRITSTEIQDIGFEYSADYSIRPTVRYSDILVLDALSTFDYINIVSFGKNYNSIPSLVVVDGLTNNIIKDVDLSYSFGDSDVTIIKNTSELSNVTPKIIPTNNSNGIKIKNITFNDSTKDVTVSLGASFSDPEDFPFSIGSKVLIEGISVGVGSTGKGFNSSNYNYSLFTLTGVTTALGGIGASVTYNLSSHLQNDEIPGTFSIFNSSGKIIPESHFPVFNPVLKKNNFYKGEVVYTSSSNGSVESWDPDNQYLKVSTINDFNKNEVIKGKTSGSFGLIKEIFTFESDYKVNAYSNVRKGWNRETGFLNNDFQRIHDSDYYQYFSYALKSQKDLNTWNNAVSTLNHTAGFKKFGNLIVESNHSNTGILTDQNQGDLVGISDLSSFVSLNCVYDYDLAQENTLNIDGAIKSDKINFNSAVIQDYIESIGNRVLLIDDFSDQFNSNPRPTAFSIVDSFPIDDFRSKKYIAMVLDKRFSNQYELSLISLLHNNSFGFLNQYGGVSTLKNLGFFDFNVFGTEGNLLFYPIKSKVNNYHVELFSFSLNDNISGIGTLSLGDSVKVETTTTVIPQGTSTAFTIVGIASTYRSAKILVQIGTVDSSYFEYDEITYIHNGSDVHLIDYGQLTTDTFVSQSSLGIGTYIAYLSGSNVNIDLVPNESTPIDYHINTINVSLGNTSTSGIGTQVIGGSSLNSSSITISSSSSPVSNIIASYSNLNYNCSYSIISIEDKTNLEYQISELLTLTNPIDCYSTEFGIVQTNSSLGIVTTGILGENTNIYFTPIENIDVDVKVFNISIGLNEESDEILFANGALNYDYGSYTGTDNDITKEFNLNYKNTPVFQRYFDGSNSNIVKIDEDTITISNHFYVTGEEIVYSYPGEGTIQAIGIATTSIPGVGTTDKLPSSLYIVKVDDRDVRVAASASDALKTIPNVLDLTSVGIGNSHIFTSKNQNNKVVIAIDNLIQSPIISTPVTTVLLEEVTFFDSEIYVSDISSIYGGDLIKINNEIMRVASVGIGSTNSISVIRPWMGTGISTHASSNLITKVFGNYNIIDNTIYFAEAPFGKIPFSNPSNRPDEFDYIGIATGSSFSGRVFLRSGVPNTSQESYKNNYIFDDISDNFNGSQKSFELKSDGINVTGISTDNTILLINSIFQSPVAPNVLGNYDLAENAGITSVTFTGTERSTNYDVNTGSVPRGGIILSIGSTQGFGYQPLVSAGGTAVVSSAGTIQAISIGNSGSGYRSGLQTIVNVGVKTENLKTSKIEFIGTAAVNNGSVVSVSITNPGSGYTTSNPPIVIFDSPLSYSNLPLIYSNQSIPGFGTGAVVDIVVGQGSSIISFELKNSGYGYKPGEILTVYIGGTTGIQTTSSLSFSEFQLTIDKIQSDQFSAWSVGSLQVIDPLDSLFDGKRTVFPILIEGNQITIRSKKGSIIDVQSTLLIFINDVLQVPGEGYIFTGGSTIRFTEAPKEGDISKIIFYKGTGDVDTQTVDILETIKVGDTVSLKSDDIALNQDDRLVTEIVSSDTLDTNIYPGPGISENENLSRPLVWCRQTEDLVVNGQQVGKNRIIYEPYIQPNTNAIQSVETASTILFVENIKTFFDSEKEYTHDGTTEKPQNKILIVSQDTLVSASGTAVVSIAGTISSIILSNGGVGYSTSPIISIGNPVGIGTSGLAAATAVVSNGSVSSILVVDGGFGYDSTQPPMVLIESPQLKYEIIDDVSYDGDFGIITGIETTSIGVASTGIVFDLFIPINSFLRNNEVVKVGIATTGISGIQTGYYFVVNNSNVGNGLTSLNSSGGIVGVGTTFIDNVYQVAAVSIAQTAVSGVGITYVAKVTVNVSNYNDLTGIGFSNFYGEYSWGTISTPIRKEPKEFISYANSGGISTSPLVQRFNRLKYLNYNT
jgi:hypothetical protein